MKASIFQNNDQYKRLVLVISLITTLITFNVYIGSELIPFTPHMDMFDFSKDIHFYGFLLFVGMHLVYLAFPDKDYLGYLLLAVFTLLCLMDINRIQPYYISYFAFLLIPRQASKEARGFVTIGTIAITYVAAGISKMNPSFQIEVFPHFFGWLADGESGFGKFLGTMIPWGEALLGVALFVPAIKTKANWVAIAMHMVIIPVKIFTNGYPVIPWNALFLCMHVVFYDEDIYGFDIQREMKSVLLAFAFVLLPILSYAGKINYIFQFPLYSGNDLRGAVFVNQDMYERLPEHYKKYCLQMGADKIIVLEYIIADNLQVAPYPDKRVYLTLAREFLPYIESDSDMVLWIRKGAITNYNKTAWAYLVKDLYGAR